MSEPDQTWELMWPRFLREAAQLAAEASPRSFGEIAKSAAAIVLARSSWDAFTSELIEWRGLPKKFKRQTFDNRIKHIAKRLGASAQVDFAAGVWRELSILNTLRNVLVHHSAEPFRNNEAPAQLLTEMGRRGLLDPSIEPATWERRFCSQAVAIWACKTVAAAISELEAIPAGRIRSLQQLQREVTFAIAPLRVSSNVERQ